jgi:hypothetical protein
MASNKPGKEKTSVLADKEKFEKNEAEEKLEHMGERTQQGQSSKPIQPGEKR